jgi:hypothetical protein
MAAPAFGRIQRWFPEVLITVKKNSGGAMQSVPAVLIPASEASHVKEGKTRVRHAGKSGDV